jgi:cytochrome oxidase Cu insertion factor (SCO1/SenC/PrrC family)
LLGDRLAVLSFVYTTCHDTNGCPLASFVLGGVQARLLETPDVRDRVRMITVTFDPEHDRPAVMRAYGERLRKAPVDWRFLTARSDAELAPTLAAYGQSVRKDYDAAGQVPRNVLARAARLSDRSPRAHPQHLQHVVPAPRHASRGHRNSAAGGEAAQGATGPRTAATGDDSGAHDAATLGLPPLPPPRP